MRSIFRPRFRRRIRRQSSSQGSHVIVAGKSLSKSGSASNGASSAPASSKPASVGWASGSLPMCSKSARAGASDLPTPTSRSAPNPKTGHTPPAYPRSTLCTYPPPVPSCRGAASRIRRRSLREVIGARAGGISCREQSRHGSGRRPGVPSGKPAGITTGCACGAP